MDVIQNARKGAFFRLFLTLLAVLFSNHLAAALADPADSALLSHLACPSIAQQALPENDGAPVNPKKLPTIVVQTLGFSSNIVDANPLFYPENKVTEDQYPRISGRKSPRDLTFEQLIALNTQRIGVAADGVSRLLLVLRSSIAGRFSLQNKLDHKSSGKLLFINDGNTCEIGSEHIALALYQAPEHFGKGSGMRDPESRVGEITESRLLELPIMLKGSGDQESLYLLKKIPLTLARPPVVLVHGTFSNGEKTWLTHTEVDSATLSDSFAETLTQKGFLPFIADYRDSNGSTLSHDSGFYDNRYVVWNGGESSSWMNDTENKQLVSSRTEQQGWLGNEVKIYPYRGGIKQAITYYRDKLGIAATQADIIGHSLGGLLARVNASLAYNTNYQRPDNFFQGDINRLITISTPHHGSELPQLLQFLTGKMRQGENPVSVALREAFSWGAWYAGVEAKQQALLDLIPTSTALKKIGKTPIPSHLFVTATRADGLKDFSYDPEQEIYKSAKTVASIFTRFPENLEAYLKLIEPEWNKTGGDASDMINIREDFMSLVIHEKEYLDWLRSEFSSWLQDVDEGSEPLTLVEALRSLFFRFDDNDNTVRVDSQKASLELNSPYVTYVANDQAADIKESVLHGYAPRYQKLQLHIVHTLKSEEELFIPELPEAGEFQPPHTEYLIKSQPVEITGSHAMAWSGMSFAHAEAFLKVANEQNVVIMGRPVNPDATILILNNAATKSMNVKGKSSNWGPQKGYLPRNQRYSKLWRTVKNPSERDAKIADFNAKTKKMLKAESVEYQIGGSKKPIAIARQLVHVWPKCPDKKTDCLKSQQSYGVWALPDKGDPETNEFATADGEENPEKAIYFCKGLPDPESPCDCKEWFDWHTSRSDIAQGREFIYDREPSIKVEPNSCMSLKPLEVLADNTLPHKPYLTADYDILTTGFYCPGGRHSSSPHCQAYVRAADKADPKQSRCSDPAKYIEADYYQGRPPTPLPCYDPHTGLITEAQKFLLDQLNRKVKETGYTGGNVSHHGPETQFFGSPYVDYPITVFEPGEDGGRVLAISKGPKGFRDIHLKRYYEQMITKGYWLYPNEYEQANWWWQARSKKQWQGYRYADHPALIKEDVEQIDPPECVKREILRKIALRRGLPAEPETPCGQQAQQGADQ